MGRIEVKELQSTTGKKTLSEEQKEIRRKRAQKKYYEKNKAKIMKQHKVYIKNFSREKKNKWASNWYHANKAKVQAKQKLKLESMTEEEKNLRRQKQKLYRAKNREKILENKKRNYWKNRDKIRASQKQYYNKTNQRDRQSSYKKNLQARKAIKINKHVLAKKDKDSIQYYINNVWNKMF